MSREYKLLGFHWGTAEGQELRRLRNAKGLQLGFCVDKIKKTRQAWNNWERGVNGPGALELTVLEEILEVEAGYFTHFATGRQQKVRRLPGPTPDPSLLDVVVSLDRLQATVQGLQDTVERLMETREGKDNERNVSRRTR
jgi:transcriptional regulator with XRE-family HTH domain